MIRSIAILLFLINYWLCILEPVTMSRYRPVKSGNLGADPNTMKDWTERCQNNDTLSTFLTFGMGQSDTSVILLSNSKNKPNCIIEFLTAATQTPIYIILVIEFPDKFRHLKKVCTNNTILVSDRETGNESFVVCDAVNEEDDRYATYFISEENTVIVEIYSNTTFDTVKFTATTGRRMLEKHEKCDNKSELLCSKDDRFDENINMCITQEVMCDSHNNCADPHDFDEDLRICNVDQFSRLWIVVVVSLIMLLVVVFFLVRLLRSSVPRVGTAFFVFNEDEDNKLNLTTTYTHPKIEVPHSKPLPSQMSRSSSYRFRAAFVAHKAQDRGERRQSWANDELLTTYVGQRPGSVEVDPHSEQTAPLKSLLKPYNKEVQVNVSQIIQPSFSEIQQYKPITDTHDLSTIITADDSCTTFLSEFDSFNHCEQSDMSCDLQPSETTEDSPMYNSLCVLRGSYVSPGLPSPYFEEELKRLQCSMNVNADDAEHEREEHLEKKDSTDLEVVEALKKHHQESLRKKNKHHPFAQVHSSRSITHRVLVHKHEDLEADEDFENMSDNLLFDTDTSRHNVCINPLPVDLSEINIGHEVEKYNSSKPIMKHNVKHEDIELQKELNEEKPLIPAEPKKIKTGPYHFVNVHSSISIAHHVLDHKQEDPDDEESLDLLPDNLVYDPITGKHHIRINPIVVNLSDFTIEDEEGKHKHFKQILRKDDKNDELAEHHSSTDNKDRPTPKRALVSSQRKSDPFATTPSSTTNDNSVRDNVSADQSKNNTPDVSRRIKIEEEEVEIEPTLFKNAVSSTHFMSLNLPNERPEYTKVSRASEAPSYQSSDFYRPNRHISYNPVIEYGSSGRKKAPVFPSDSSKMPPRSILSSRVSSKVEEEYYRPGAFALDGIVMEVRKKKKRIADVKSSTHVIHPKKERGGKGTQEKKSERQPRRRASNSSDSYDM